MWQIVASRGHARISTNAEARELFGKGLRGLAGEALPRSALLAAGWLGDLPVTCGGLPNLFVSDRIREQQARLRTRSGEGNRRGRRDRRRSSVHARRTTAAVTASIPFILRTVLCQGPHGLLGANVWSEESKVTEPLQDLLRELERFGLSNDAVIADRSRRMLNITRDTGEFLSVLVRAMHAQRVLEIGTSNGYSTLWLAWAARAVQGHVTTLEFSEFKRAMAMKNFERSGLVSLITSVHGEAGLWLKNCPEASFDLVFLDSERSQYPVWWPDIRRVLRQGGLLVVDNATSHSAEMAPLIALVCADPDFTTCTVPVGNGEFLATRVSRESSCAGGPSRRPAQLVG